MSAPANASRPLTAFVFAGGGSLGSIQAGMLRVLAAHGIVPDMVVGSSVGAINAAFYAGYPTLQGVTQLENIWRSLRRQDVFPIAWRNLIGIAQKGKYLVASDGLRRLCELHLPYRDLSAARLPVHVVATNMLSGGTVVLSRGSVVDAVMASTAIPAAFAPVLIDGQYLVDGAITSNTPIKVAVACGARRLIVLPTGYACALERPPQGVVATALHALTLLIARQLLAELHELDAGIEYRIVPPLCPLNRSPYDFSHTGELIERAARSTEEWLAGGGMDRRDIPHTMNTHAHH
jgi:NTE family protein